MSGWGESNYREARRWIPKAGKWPCPVRLTLKPAWWISGSLLPPLNQSGALPAAMDLVGELLRDNFVGGT